MRRKRLQWGASAVAALLGATACAASSSNSAGSSGSTSASGGACPTVQGVTKDKITLGITTPLSGPAASIGQQGLDAQQAFVDSVNAEGGINGRKLELISQDDGFNAQKAVSNAQYLINQKKVFALWGDVGTAESVAVMPVTEQAKVPFLFPYALSRDLTEPVKPYVFSIATTAYAQNVSLSNYMANNAPFKGKKVGLLVISSADGQQTAAGFKAGADASQVVSTQTYDANVSTFNNQLLAMKQAGAQVIYTGVNDTQFAQILSEAKSIGMLSNSIFFGSTGTVTSNVFKLAKDTVEGQYALVFAASDASGGGAQAQALKQALAKYVPKASIGTFSTVAWVSGLLLKAALQKAGSCVTPDTLKTAMESITNFDTGSLTGPISFSADNHLGNKSIKVLQAKGGSWVAVTGFVQK